MSFALLAILAICAAGDGETKAATEPAIAIQRPKFLMAHELGLSAGSMPLDAFQKGWSLGLSYSIHFDEYITWEVLDVRIAALVSTNLRDSLIDTFAIPPEDFNAPRLMATTGLEVSPIYGKQVFLNDTVVHQAVYLGAHAGVIFGDRETFGDTLADLRPAVGLGIGYRVFLSKSFSLRFDFRDFLSFRRAIKSNETADIDNVMLISGSISLNFWRDDA